MEAITSNQDATAWLLLVLLTLGGILIMGLVAHYLYGYRKRWSVPAASLQVLAMLVLSIFSFSTFISFRHPFFEVDTYFLWLLPAYLVIFFVAQPLYIRRLRHADLYQVD